MAISVLRMCLLLAILCVTDGQSTTAEDSHCSYTFKVPTNDCGQTQMEDQLTKSLLVALQTQVKFLARNQDKLTDANTKHNACYKLYCFVLIDVRMYTLIKIAIIILLLCLGRNRSDVNVKQCSKSGMNDQREYGLLFSCDFVKKRDDTVLRVVWNGNLRLIHTGPKHASVRRWFFTINGKECSDPSTIDAQLYVRDSDSDNHRPAYVEGYCRGIAAGDVYVAWNIGDILSDQPLLNVGDSYTGWKATVRIIVEEVDVESADTVIV
ncbi:hypothetical protein NP493_1290g02018 [Ridgeia piscesae]|uniref:CTHRC1 C-terminal domain-containing protein n=1 Tax=Ridgeia piscesae TaxID=27915 RepID=A0AAD9K8F6_RIDPI|nr:hypothetical protein NP493_1290g02018 [Ridgeia piscesae]